MDIKERALLRSSYHRLSQGLLKSKATDTVTAGWRWRLSKIHFAKQMRKVTKYGTNQESK